MPDPEPRDLLAMTGVQEPDRRSIDAAESEAFLAIEIACYQSRWHLVEGPTLEGDGDEAVIACIRLELSGVPCYPDGQAVVEELADKLVALAAELDKRTGRIRYPRIGAK